MVLIRLKNIVAAVNHAFTLKIPEWSLKKGESWLICGPNASGKSLFGELLLNQIDFTGERYVCADASRDGGIAIVSPGLDEEIFEEEKRNDDSEFMEGGFDPGRTALEIIYDRNRSVDIDPAYLNDLLDMFNIRHVSDKGYQFLSSGETRKVLIVSALVKKPDILILDTPYSGLDFNSQIRLRNSLEHLIASGTQLILIASPRFRPPNGMDHVLFLDHGEVVITGRINDIRQSQIWLDGSRPQPVPHEAFPGKYAYAPPVETDILVELHQVSVS